MMRYYITVYFISTGSSNIKMRIVRFIIIVLILIALSNNAFCRFFNIYTSNENDTNKDTLHTSKEVIYFDSCHKAMPFCGFSSYIVGGTWVIYAGEECCPGQTVIDCCVDYSCVNNSIVNPRWFFLEVDEPGDISILIYTNPLRGTEFICWGPYELPTNACVEQLTSEKIIDCDAWGVSIVDTCTISNAQTGQFYILMIPTEVNGPNYTPVELIFHQWNYGFPNAGSTRCEIVSNCTVVSLTSNPSECNTISNTFDLSGQVYFVNPPLTGQLVIWDSITGFSSTFNAPFSSPIGYSITNLPCDNMLHTVTASFWDSSYCELEASFLAPVLCPDATLSGGGNICNDGVSLTEIEISFTPNAQLPYTFSWYIDGVMQPPIINYIGVLPYTFTTNQPGIYTMATSSNSFCTGQVNGQATVNLLPIPNVNLGEDILACFGSSVVLEAGVGYTSYLWSNELNTPTIQVSNGGMYSVIVSDTNGCTATDTIMVQFRPEILGKIIKHN